MDAAQQQGATALMISSQNGHEKCARALIKAGAQVDQLGPEGSTALMFAARKGHVHCANVLITAGAKVNVATNNGATAVMLAARNGHEECVYVLLEVGAEADRAVEDGSTALMAACESGHDSCTRALLAAGVPADTIVDHTWRGVTVIIHEQPFRDGPYFSMSTLRERAAADPIPTQRLLAGWETSCTRRSEPNAMETLLDQTQLTCK